MLTKRHTWFYYLIIHVDGLCYDAKILFEVSSLEDVFINQRILYI